MAMNERFLRATEMAHEIVRARVHAGDMAIDATLGGGTDLVFLSGCVGATGKLLGFDVQAEAVERSRARLGPRDGVELHAVGHERMAEFVDAEVAVVMFNLGYLPGGDKSVITRTETTLAALATATEFLRPGGVVTVVCYSGHAGGDHETTAVVDWVVDLAQEEFSVLRYGFVNQRNSPPFLVAVERR